jgi:hypothetical protein
MYAPPKLCPPDPSLVTYLLLQVEAFSKRFVPAYRLSIPYVLSFTGVMLFEGFCNDADLLEVASIGFVWSTPKKDIAPAIA